ncbi:hypothetical protein QAD02_015147 [Eretmocerus hayati]|uniref:Uncharacterized protein n=1 Tax=Eretmocerus hayati TaxID=131215 RepID=A0ACC2P6Y4_9HYME|nr:hypothetical protein QAD02_015147 [Eretmocerus hayati]
MERKSSNMTDNGDQFRVIESLLDLTAPPQKYPKSGKMKKKTSRSSSGSSCSVNESQPIDYYPNVDSTVWMRSCEQEIIEPINGKLLGQIPDWLTGSLLRNGPGSLKVGEYRFDHLFDSSAFLHRFEINNGNVTYQNRFVQTDVYKRNHAAKRIVTTEFGTRAIPDPCQTIFQRVSTLFTATELMSDNSMISIYPIGDEYYTFTESPIIHRIDPKTLETLSKVDVANFVNIVSHTSHPHVMSDKSVYNLGLSITKKGPTYIIVKFSPLNCLKKGNLAEHNSTMFEQAKIVATVPCRWILNPSYMHTFGITENYFIIVEQPLAIGLTSLVTSKLRNEPMNSCFKFHKDENTHIQLISRKSGKVEQTFVAESFFFLHIINQYETEDGSYVILDICCYRDAQMLDCMYVESMQNMHQNPNYSKLFRGRPLRFILPLNCQNMNVSPETDLIDLTCSKISTNIPGYRNDKKKTRGRKRKIEIDKGNEKTGKKEHTSGQKDVLCQKAAAFKLPNGQIFVRPELLCNLGCETPRINSEKHLGKEYRYFYAMSSDVDIENPGTIIKVDVENKTKKTWCEKNVYPSEPIFVPDPGGKNEDDGVIVSALVWGQDRDKEVGLLVLNAATFKEIARATFVTPGPVPKCLHGWFSNVVS